MAETVTWTQFATVLGLLVALAGAGGYFFKQWQEAAFGQIIQRLDQIDRRLDRIEAKMVTKEELRAELAEMELRLRAEAPPTPPGGATS